MALLPRDDDPQHPPQVHYQDFRHWSIYVGDARVDIFTAIPEDTGKGQVLLLLRDAVKVLFENKDTNKLLDKFKERKTNIKAWIPPLKSSMSQTDILNK